MLARMHLHVRALAINRTRLRALPACVARSVVPPHDCCGALCIFPNAHAQADVRAEIIRNVTEQTQPVDQYPKGRQFLNDEEYMSILKASGGGLCPGLGTGLGCPSAFRTPPHETEPSGSSACPGMTRST